MFVQLFSRLCVRRGEETGVAPKGRKTWGLLTHLVRSEVPPSRQRLTELLFPEAEDPLAGVRWTSVHARRVLRSVSDEADVGGDPVRLFLPPDAVVDVAVVTSGRWSEATRVPALGCDLLEGQTFPSAPAFELRLDGERRHLRAQCVAVLHGAGIASLAVRSRRRGPAPTRLLRPRPPRPPRRRPARTARRGPAARARGGCRMHPPATADPSTHLTQE